MVAYTRLVPQANQKINKTQVPIENNFISADDAMGIDHYAFSDTSGTTPGKHKGIHLPIQAATIATNDVANQWGIVNVMNAGIPKIHLMPPGRAAGGFGYLLTGPTTADTPANNPGYTTLFGGFLLQWGLTGAIATGTPVSFGVAFPAACLSVVLTPYGGSGGNIGYWTTGVGLGSFIVNHSHTAGGGTRQFYWFAMGY